MRAEFEHLAEQDGISWHYRVRSEAAFDFQWHFHPEVELTLITRGSGTRVVGDSIENYWPGDLTLIGSELPHTYASAPDHTEHEAVVIHFRPDFLGPAFLTRPEFAAIGRLLETAVRGVNVAPASRTVTEAMHALATGRPVDRTLGLLQLLSRLAEDSGVRTLTTATSRPPLRAITRARVEAVHAHLSSSYTGPVHLAEVAAVAHLTPAAFGRFFHRTFGRTLTDYVTELRIAAACRLLGDTDLTVADIAARVGYQNLANFNRRFRALKGVSPREYRAIVTGRAHSAG